MSGFRNAKGQFLPNTMKANEVIEAGLSDKYVVSANYQGPAERAVCYLEKPNPWSKGDPAAPPPGNGPPNLVSPKDKYSGSS